jgi:hypothetical protein
VYLQSSVTFLGRVCPETVSLLVLCEDVRVAFSPEASMLSLGWHVLKEGLGEVLVLSDDGV